MTTQDILTQAAAARRVMAVADTAQKNRALGAMGEALLAHTPQILAANEADLEAARSSIGTVMLDRLALNEGRIQAMAEGMGQVAQLPDPVGRELGRVERPNGLCIRKVSVPMGTVAIIYESRPNVTADAAALCIKSGNACVLRGGKEAFGSNQAIVDALQAGLAAAGLPKAAVSLIQDTSRDSAQALMRANGMVDLLIPRGGAGLIQTVVQNATVPVIETGVGNCHVYVDESADLDMALDIVFNAKTQRIGVCNACESLLVHRAVAERFLPRLKEKLEEKQVEIRGDEASRAVVPEFAAASEEDWGKEYLDYILSCKVVDSVDEAIRHINRYNTGHSETIVTGSYENAQRFLDQVDAAAVYVNASTRFTDGFEFGFGAEIGISTQKLHARGPMGLLALTSTKYIIYGNGQIRK